MQQRTLTPTWTSVLALALGWVALSNPGPARADSLRQFAQGSKAMGMAGAFVAQADDPSAIFYNVAGPALAKGKKVSIGLVAFTLNESLYQGLPPGIGAGTTGAQDDKMTLHPHVYVVMPLGAKAKLGLGISSPYFLDAAWLDADSFAGRAIATNAKLTTYDVTASLSFPLGETLGIGVGAIYRTSEIEHSRRLLRFNPLSGSDVDVASVGFKTDFSDGVGWTFGLLHKPSDRFSWGLSYRSPIEIDYVGVGSLTQISTGNDQLDALFRATLPFGEDLATATRLELPEVLSLGVAVGLTPKLLLEVDAERIGWSSVQRLDLEFPTEPSLGTSIPLDLDDSMSYRAGLRYTTATGIQLRLGAGFEESPQPDATVGAFLMDSERSLLAVGVGLDWLDVAFVWVDAAQRIVGNQVDGLNGNYRSSAWMLGLTISM